MDIILKALNYGLGACAIVAAAYLINSLINKFADSKKENGSTEGNLVAKALEENSKAITKLTTFLETRAKYEDERTLAILGKTEVIETVVREISLKLNQRPCMKYKGEQ